MAPKIPDRWLDYKPYGEVIEGTRIICFKVPLKSKISLNSSNNWTIEIMLQELHDLGGVIDLTNTRRYYNPSELLSAGVRFKKIYMPGRIIPPEGKVKEFKEAMDQFLQEANGFRIGVHCTHGLNRTGYMVCRYMRDVLGIPPAEAIRRFEVARGYRIERQNYIDHILGKRRCAPPVFGGSTSTSVVPVGQMRNRKTRSKKNCVTSDSEVKESSKRRRRR